MTLVEYIWWCLTDQVPERYGKRVKVGRWYDSYHNKTTGESWVLEKETGKFFERK